MLHPLLPKFIRSFQKAIKAEMKAMRQRLGPFEVPLANGRVLDADDSNQGRIYVFKVLQPNDKLVLQAECTLWYETSEALSASQEHEVNSSSFPMFPISTLIHPTASSIKCCNRPSSPVSGFHFRPPSQPLAANTIRLGTMATRSG
jgi:hypothetical protein